MEQQTIRIKYHSNEIEKLTYIDGKSDWIDLRSAEHVVLKKGEFKLIKLGVSMHLQCVTRRSMSMTASASSASRNISRSSVLRRQIHLAMKTAAVSEAPEERKL